MFNEDDLLAFIYDGNVNVEVPKIMRNSYVIASSASATKLKLDRSAAFIIHLEKEEFLNNTFTFLKSSSFWISNQSLNSPYLIILKEKSSTDVKEIFTYFWKLKIHKVVVFTQHNSNNHSTVKIHTSDPFYKENGCGAYVNIVYSQKCSDALSIKFSKKYRNINGCSIIFMTQRPNEMTAVKKFQFNFFNRLAKKLNGNFVVNYTSNIIEKQSIMMQPVIAIATAFDNDPNLNAYAFTNTAIIIKLVILVKKGDVISPVKTLFIIFKTEVWIMIILCIGITSFALWLILSIEKKQFNIADLGTVWLNVYLSTIWGYFLSVPKTIKARYIIICYLVYQIHIQTGFTSNLVTVLTTPQYQLGITNFKQLIESKLPIISSPGSELFFPETGKPNSIYSKIRNQMHYMDIRLTEIIKCLDSNSCAMLLMDLEVEHLKFMIGGNLHVNSIEAGLVTGNVRCSYIMSRGHFFKDTLNSFLRSMDESDRLRKKIEYFNKTTIQNYLAQERWEKTEKMTIETESQTDAWKAHSKETKEIAIQTTQWTAEGKEMIDSVENVNTYEEWKQVAEEEWGDSAYVHTKIVEGHPLQETTGTSTLWVTEKEVEENTGLQLMIEKVYPEINKGKEEIETMERETKTKTKNNTNIKKIKIIRIIYQDHEEDVWKKLETIKSETEEDEKIMLHKLKTMSVNRLRKMAECIFKTKKTRINIIVPKDTQTQQSIAKQDNQKKTYALVVEQKGKNTKN
ncbi:hypothetical protein RN001_007260 [Aquatica leii]|uniref:Ionotropic glutamate receptor C-terminal domain-containing protein n=1 Tax=Aquatica leii TaxID=1421715 RepID=A0AAN7P8G6_9COLE|nr:hypothetical protein RN001_007260 [Aquatica leii]